MTFQYSFHFVAAATISLTALSVQAQSTRAHEMGAGTTITSLTSLYPPRHAFPPYGAIDASVIYSVALDVSATPDLTSAEIPNQLQAGRASGYSGLKGFATSQLVPSGSSPGRNPEGVSASIAAAKVYSVQTPSTQFHQEGSPHSRQSASSQSLPPLVVGNMSQSGSMPKAPPASKALHSTGHTHHGRDFSGSHQFTSGRSLPSVRAFSGNASAPSSRLNQSASDSDESASDSNEPASDLSPEDDGPSDLDASTNEPNPTAGDQQEERGFFEVVGDPFGQPFSAGVTGKRLEMERTCGGACSLKRSSPKSEDVASDMPESGGSIRPSSRSNDKLNGKMPRSGPERTLGGFSDDASRSGSQPRRNLKNLNEVDRGSSDSVVRMKSSD
jgi:hypothetical protein